jgi:hypothetical protein
MTGLPVEFVRTRTCAERSRRSHLFNGPLTGSQWLCLSKMVILQGITLPRRRHHLDDAWSARLPVSPRARPYIDDADGPIPWLEIKCSRCKTPRDVDLCALRHVPTTCVHDLAGRLVLSEVQEGWEATGCQAAPACAASAPSVARGSAQRSIKRSEAGYVAASAVSPRVFFIHYR